MLCTLLAPTGGRATVAGFDIADAAQHVRLRIGVALQDVALDPKQTGVELLRLQGQLYGLDRGRDRPAAGRAARRWSTSATPSNGGSTPTPAACGVGSTSPPRSCTTPTCCSSTSRPPGSTRSAAPACGRRCGGSTTSSGMTILLTTQYLEEADELADRVGIVDRGTPRRRGNARRAEAQRRHRRRRRPRRGRRRGRARRARRASYGVVAVEGRDRELTISVDDGSAAIGPVAVALARLRRSGSATSRCARRRSTTCSSS